MRKIYFYVLGLILIASCSLDLREGQEKTGEIVSVSLSLDVENLMTGTPDFDVPFSDGTKGVYDAAVPSIQDLIVLQYDGTTDDAELAISPIYIPVYSKFVEDNENINLMTSNEENTIVFIANIKDPGLWRTIPVGSTISELKKRSKVLTGQSDLFGPDSGDYHIMLNGSRNVIISPGGADIECTLKRNIAKVNFNLTVAEGAGVNVLSVELRSVPAVSYYYTSHIAESDIFPDASTYSTVDYTPYYSTTITDNKTEYVFYTSVNQRGKTNLNANGESYKNKFAPAYSTYVQVNATYKEGSADIPITYKFYLGANLTDDFNLRPNYQYTYNIEIKSKGNATTDDRIEDWGMVDFRDLPADMDANCYILNPIPIEGGVRTFYIPVSRIDKFWGGNGYENNLNYALGEDRAWVVEILWADFDYKTEDKVTLSKSDGNGRYDAFGVQVKSGVNGNMVVGVRLSGNSQYSWSWHLWITDYQPDDAADANNIRPETYIYSVTNGEIHRYSGASWETGRYKNSFMMDRSLGALSTDYAGRGQGAIFYQFGRKDPFPSFYYMTLYGPMQPTKNNLLDAGSHILQVDEMILNPHRFIIGSYWAMGNYNPTATNTSIIWQDYNAKVTSEEPLPKSIFDPCPPGWCVPLDDAWGDFRMNTASNPTTNIAMGESPKRTFTTFKDSNIGLRYWPYSSDETSVTEEIYYPAAGWFATHSGLQQFEGSYGYYWCSNQYNYSTALTFHFQETSMSTYSVSRGYGFPVRCVKQ